MYSNLKKRGKTTMAIFIILFMVAGYVTTTFLSTVMNNAEAIYTILAIVLFMGVGLMFIQSMRGIGTTVLLTAVVLMVAVQALQPYYMFVARAAAVAVAMLGTVTFKRPMLRFVRNDERRSKPTLPTWARWTIRLI